MLKYNIIALIGKAGSGKDTLLHRVKYEMPELNEIISFTTRPPREGEKDGKNYYFLTEKEFKDKISKNEILEYNCFNGWYYGTGYISLDKNKINIGVFNPQGIYDLNNKNFRDINLKVFYVCAHDKERLMRQLTRELNPDIKEIIRRYNTDEIDFSDLKFTYDILPNDNSIELSFNTKEVIRVAKEIL